MSRTKVIRLATRASKLALTQSKMVASFLSARFPELKIELVKVSTQGDRDQTTPLSHFGGTGLFVKELEAYLLDGRADFAVHSLKDVPSHYHPDLKLVSFPTREDTRDVLITMNGYSWQELNDGATIGTSSASRRAQLKKLRPDLEFKEIRGNIDTRMAKLENGEYDGIILAAAGLNRLEIPYPKNGFVAVDDVIPSPGQGCLAIQARKADTALHNILRTINDPKSALAVYYERLFMEAVGGSCRYPIGAHVSFVKEKASIKVMLGSEGSDAFNTASETCYVKDIEATMNILINQIKK